MSSLQFSFLAVAGTYSLTALVIYEYMLTMPTEVAKMWRRGRWTASTWLFMVNRYASIAIMILTVFARFATSSSTLRFQTILINAVVTIQNTTFTAFSTLRVFALRGRGSYLYVVVFALGLVPLAVFLYNAIHHSSIVKSVSGSPEHTQGPAGLPTLTFRLTVAAIVSVICMEMLVIFATWHSLGRDARESREILGPKTLAGAMWEGGIIYFSALLMMGFVTILALVHLGTSTVAFIGYFNSTLQAILISRFLLNLREANETGNISQGSQSTHVRFRFPAVLQANFSIGNMGERLDYAGANDDIEEDAEEPDALAESPHTWRVETDDGNGYNMVDLENREESLA